MITLKSTHKMAIARMASFAILGWRRVWGLSEQTIVRRGGLAWKLDLTEGIDLSIYLLGGFEPRTLKVYTQVVKPGDTVLDIGANIGAHALPLARLVGEHGQVFAFEPTRYANAKMRANMELNKSISARISLRQVMLVDKEGGAMPSQVYASWPVNGSRQETHRQHGGRLMSTDDAAPRTLDQEMRDSEIKSVDFIKLDVDGHEADVLAGGTDTLKTFRPPILMELAPYLYEQGNGALESMVNLLAGLGYSLADACSKETLPWDPARLREIIPTGTTRNVLLHPPKKHEPGIRR